MQLNEVEETVDEIPEETVDEIPEEIPHANRRLKAVDTSEFMGSFL